MSDRKAELEAKKERLRLLREEKERRKREKEAKEARDAAQNAVSGQAASSAAHKDINDQLKGLGVATVEEVVGQIPQAEEAQRRRRKEDESAAAAAALIAAHKVSVLNITRYSPKLTLFQIIGPILLLWFLSG